MFVFFFKLLFFCCFVISNHNFFIILPCVFFVICSFFFKFIFVFFFCYCFFLHCIFVFLSFDFCVCVCFFVMFCILCWVFISKQFGVATLFLLCVFCLEFSVFVIPFLYSRFFGCFICVCVFFFRNGLICVMIFIVCFWFLSEMFKAVLFCLLLFIETLFCFWFVQKEKLTLRFCTRKWLHMPIVVQCAN